MAQPNYLSALNWLNNPGALGGSGSGIQPTSMQQLGLGPLNNNTYGNLGNLGAGNANQNGADGGIMQMLFGNPETGAQGMALPAVQSLSGLASTYLGMKQYGMAKDAFKESKRQFNLNFDAQKKSYNNRLADRQRARVASAGEGSDTYQSEAEYMKKWSM